MYDTFLYNPQRGISCEKLDTAGMREALKDPSNLLWLDLIEISDEEIDFLTEVFNLHPLTIEDFIMSNPRPKVENFITYFFLVMFSIGNGNKGKGRIAVGEINFCLGRNFLISAHNEEIPILSAAKKRVREQSPIIKNGGDFLLHSIVDNLVDTYFPVIHEFDNTVDQLSDELFTDPSNDTLKKIYLLKNEIVYLRRTIGPQVDVMNLLTRGDLPNITPANIAYFRNVCDNLVRLNDVVGTSRDIVTGAMEAYVSVVSNRLNEIMKTLTVIATIMMPLTLIASIYGMNFKHMPELSSKFGYPLVIGLMVLLTAGMLSYFKRRGWI